MEGAFLGGMQLICRARKDLGSTRSTWYDIFFWVIVVFCTNSIVADIPIPTGTLVTSRSGATYRTIGNFVMSSVDKNRLAANASRMRKSLNIAGISSRHAMEIPVQATRNGTSGNVSSLQIVSTNLNEAVSVANITSMTGGSNNETDDSFRSRILSIFIIASRIISAADP